MRKYAPPGSKVIDENIEHYNKCSKREPCGTPLLVDEVSFDGGLQKHEARRIIAGYQWEGCLSKAFFFCFSASSNCLNIHVTFLNP